MQVRDANVWKDSEPYVRDGGVWKPVDTGFVRDAGVWKEFFSGSAPPFDISGSWETGNEGWTLAGNAIRGSAQTARTGSFSIYYQTSGGTNPRATRSFTGAETAGLKITASVWIKSSFNANYAGGVIIRANGVEVAQSLADTTMSWVQRSAEYMNTSGADIEIEYRIAPSTTYGIPNVLDDWRVAGTPL